MSDTIIEWIPLERLGPFVFGSSINEYITKFNLELVSEEYNEKVGWEVYSGIKGLSLYSENGKVEAVSCSISCSYQGVRIINNSIEKVISALNAKPSSVEQEELMEGPHEVYDFDEFGLQAWVKEGKVVTVICSGA